MRLDLSLHSIMFLLIPRSTKIFRGNYDFTFHYVSINTDTERLSIQLLLPLHSIMFLLILRVQMIEYHSKWTLHSIMFLLIL